MNRRAKEVMEFPELPIKVIVQIFEEMRIPLSDSDITKPNPSQVQRVFETLLEMFTGTGKESYSQPSFSVMEMVEYPELHYDSISLIAFYRAMLNFVSQIGIDDFSLKDIIRPEPNRLRKIYSGIINFAKFREEQLVVFERLMGQSEETNETRNYLYQQNHDLNQKIEVLKAERQKEEPLIKELKDSIALLLTQLKEFKRIQETMSNEMEKLKTERNEFSDKIANNQFISMNLKQECHKLKSRIVHSPEKLLSIISELNSSIVSEKSNLSALEKKSREVQLKFDSLIAIELDLVKSIQIMEECDEEIKKFEQANAQVDNEKSLIEKKEIQIKDVDVKNQQVNRQIATLAEKLQRLQQQQIVRREEIEKQLESCRNEYAAIAKERAAIQGKLEINEKLIKDMEHKISELKRQHESEIFAVQADYMTLRTQVSSYLMDMKNSILLESK